MAIKLLLVDDDTDFVDVTSYALRRAGFELTRALTGVEALELAESEQPDIVLLDVELPGMSGLEVCARLRQTSRTPIVLISAHRQESDMIGGFEAGADDYIVKPVNIRPLVLRLRALDRRAHARTPELAPRRVVLKDLEIDADAFSVTLAHHPLHLTTREFHLLYSLAVNAGRVVPSARLIDYAWGVEADGDHTILKTHFSHIRSKLRQAGSSIDIRSVPGVGYRLDLQGEPDPLRPR
jgi:DNA-binding response OmpR family regulator